MSQENKPQGEAELDLVEKAITRALTRLQAMPVEELVKARYGKFRGVRHYL